MDRGANDATKRTAATAAYRRIRELILTTDLRPGQPLAESDLMATLGIGRTPLRDALRLLSHDGLVVIEPRRGTAVAPLTSIHGWLVVVGVYAVIFGLGRVGGGGGERPSVSGRGGPGGVGVIGLSALEDAVCGAPAAELVLAGGDG